MKTVKIQLGSIDKVKAFVHKTTNYLGNLDLVSGRYVVDAKSIMGIFSIDLTKAIQLNVHGDNAEQIDSFIDSISAFIVA